MKLARYWARDEGEATDNHGQRIRAKARGWSDESLEAARSRARDIARRVAERMAIHPGERKQYEYGDRPLPEPVIRELGSGAVVTRNSYGALVLNTDHMMFIDIDGEDSEPAAGGFQQMLSGIVSLFGKKSPASGPEVPNTLLDRIQQAAERRYLSGRVYKTAGGYRALITNAAFRAGSPEAEVVLNEFGSDRMYMRLCRVQESFRARLTPKPWRCGFRRPPVEFPFETPQSQAQYSRWEARYNSKTADCATCRYVSSFGAANILPEFTDLVKYHDVEMKAASALPLA